MVSSFNFGNDAPFAADGKTCVDDETLVCLVLDSVQKVEHGRLSPVPAEPGGDIFTPRMLLALVTYCYAVGIYSSQSIEERICRDDMLRYLCAWKFANRDLIRRFREQNRLVIERCLLHICLALRKRQLRAQKLDGAAAAEETARGTDTCFDPTWRIQITCDVRERLNRAELEDGSPLPKRATEPGAEVGEHFSRGTSV